MGQMEGARPEKDCTPDKDRERTLEFADAMWVKWQKGRSEHGTTVKIDPLEEAQKECVDIANYAMETYFRLGRMREEVARIMRKEDRRG